MPSVQLEALADAFQEKMIQSGKVQDRHFLNRTVPKSFQGNDAVAVLHHLIQDQSGLQTVTQSQALQAGRDIQTQFLFIRHTKNIFNQEKLLEDSETDLYQFQNNLPMQVYKMRKKYPSMWDKVTLLENRVPLGDHRGLVKLHTHSFLAKEAVNVLMEVKLVKSRHEAIQLIKKMNEKVQCCRMADHPGNHGMNFKDDNSVYMFVPNEERIPPQHHDHHHHRHHRSKSPMRKQKTCEEAEHGKRSAQHDHPTKTKSHSPTKDASYFNNRANSVRNRLDQQRQERAANASPTPAKDDSKQSVLEE